MKLWGHSLIVAAFILAGGFFSLFQYALQFVNKPRLLNEIDNPALSRRKKKYRQLLACVEQPGRHNAAAFFWILLLKICSAVFTGVFISLYFPENGQRLLPITASVVLLVSVWLILGDLIPRNLAMNKPERIAADALPLVKIFAFPLQPFFFLAGKIGKKMHLSYDGMKSGITEEELHIALLEGEKSGIVAGNERSMVEGVFYLGDRPLGAFMTHRSDIHWLDIHASLQEIREKTVQFRAQGCFPIAESSLDAILGIAYPEDIILDLTSPTPLGLQAVMKKALFAPQTMPALKAFEVFRRGEANYLFVIDEYGGFAGMVSVRNLVEEIVGELSPPGENENEITVQEDGSWVASGTVNIDEAADILQMPNLSAGEGYHTLAGLILSLAGELPQTGDAFVYQANRFTVLDMDGNRINKIGIRKEE